MAYAERDLVRVMVVRPSGTDQYEHDDGRLQQTFDIGTTAIYVGYALKGVAAGTAEWTIKKITLDASGNPTNLQWTAERGATWTSRASESYT